MSKSYSSHTKKLNEALRMLKMAININDEKKIIRRWVIKLESDAKLLKDLLTEQINDEGKLPQGELFTEGVFGKVTVNPADAEKAGLGKCDIQEQCYAAIRTGEPLEKKILEKINSISSLPYSDSANSDSGSPEKRKGSDTY